MNANLTYFDKILVAIKNNRVLSFVPIFGTIVITLGTFADASHKIGAILSREQTVNIAGTWQTQDLVNPDASNEHSALIFEFQQERDKVSGKLTEINRQDGQRATWGIVNGKLTGRTMSFYVDGDSTRGSYRRTFSGRVNEGNTEISMTQQLRLPGFYSTPQTFIAKRSQ